ncbi:MAG: aminodeoxychorismate synthase component I [Methylophilales bacterium]|nr:aminodeoxychorismate synthase component I [Methylophilales bacterium]
MTALLSELPYQSDSTALFAAIAHKPWAMWLDSGRPQSKHGRYDIMVADPVITLTTRGDLTEICTPTSSEISRQNPLDLVRDYLGRQQKCESDLPFMGGAVGYFGYDLARRLEKLSSIAQHAENLPDMQVGIYDWALVVDHQERRSFLASYGRAPLTHEHWQQLVHCFTQPVESAKSLFKVLSPIISNMSESQYQSAFQRIQRYIVEGDCYQVNLAQRFSAQVDGDPWLAYQNLREHSPAPFSAYLNLPDVQILCNSPERFLQVKHRQVLTQPIKGTRPTSSDLAQNAVNIQDLKNSSKDRAENLMIVDLLRNDIGKNCLPGSVKADQLFALESFANVHHLVSTVTGQLAPGHTATHLLRGCFPGGSITGAPKLRAMQIIEELEPHRRGVYCGAIGYIGFDGNMDTNIAIRTAVVAQGSISFCAGGGIVADSVGEQEYRETWDKASTMLELIRRFS